MDLQSIVQLTKMQVDDLARKGLEPKLVSGTHQLRCGPVSNFMMGDDSFYDAMLEATLKDMSHPNLPFGADAFVKLRFYEQRQAIGKQVYCSLALYQLAPAKN